MPSYDPTSTEYTKLDALMRLDESVSALSNMLQELLGNIRCELEEINQTINSIHEKQKLDSF